MEAWQDISIFALTQFFMLVGLIGLVIPIFPGMLVMWLAVLGYAIATGWGTLGVILFIFITLLTIAGMLVDNVLMGLGARQGGASWVTIGVAMIAGVAGTVVFPPFGGFIAAPAAVLLLEYYRMRDWKKVWTAVRGLATGWGASFFVRFLIGLFMMGLWWVWAWLG